MEPDVARLYAALAAEALRLAEPELTVEQVEALRGVIGSPHA
jgi:hypothetical protein